MDDVMYFFEYLVHVQRAVAQRSRFVQPGLYFALHWHCDALPRPDLHAREGRDAHIAVRVEDDTQFDIRVTRVEEFQIGGVGAQAAVPVQNAVLPIVGVIVVAVLLPLYEFQAAVGCAAGLDGADVHSRRQFQIGVHVGQLTERERLHCERVVKRHLAIFVGPHGGAVINNIALHLRVCYRVDAVPARAVNLWRVCAMHSQCAIVYRIL